MDIWAEQDEKWMRIAIEAGRRGVERGQSPFGAVVVRGEELIVCAHNVVMETMDITAHAEVNAIRQACRKLNDVHLRRCTIYSTCEPCPMCFSAIHWADMERIVYGAAIGDAAGAGFNELTISNGQMKEIGGSRVEVTGGVLRAENVALFQEWMTRPGRQAY